jgi:hypothetical protein
MTNNIAMVLCAIVILPDLIEYFKRKNQSQAAN